MYLNQRSNVNQKYFINIIFRELMNKENRVDLIEKVKVDNMFMFFI